MWWYIRNNIFVIQNSQIHIQIPMLIVFCHTYIFLCLINHKRLNVIFFHYMWRGKSCDSQRFLWPQHLMKRFYQFWDTMYATACIHSSPLQQAFVTWLTASVIYMKLCFNYNIIKIIHEQTIQPKKLTSKRYFQWRSMAQVGIGEERLILAASTGSTPCIGMAYEPNCANLLLPWVHCVSRGACCYLAMRTCRAAVGPPAVSGLHVSALAGKPGLAMGSENQSPLNVLCCVRQH